MACDKSTTEHIQVARRRMSIAKRQPSSGTRKAFAEQALDAGQRHSHSGITVEAVGRWISRLASAALHLHLHLLCRGTH